MFLTTKNLFTHGEKMFLLPNATFIHTVANVSTILFVVVIVLQILLALGFLPISMAWGGRQSQLTPSLRIASLVAVVLLGTFIYVIRYRAGLLGVMPIPMFIKIFSWIITAFMSFNILGNIASSSKMERLIFTPITVLLTFTCLIVSVSNPAI
jgi:hypothetical protein